MEGIPPSTGMNDLGGVPRTNKVTRVTPNGLQELINITFFYEAPQLILVPSFLYPREGTQGSLKRVFGAQFFREYVL